jgi:hypothetical protein
MSSFGFGILWFDGCLGFEPKAARSRRLKYFAAGGQKSRWPTATVTVGERVAGGSASCAPSFNYTVAFALWHRKLTEILNQSRHARYIYKD